MNPNSTDTLASYANSVAIAILLKDAAMRLGRSDSYYQEIIDKRINSLIAYLRMEK